MACAILECRGDVGGARVVDAMPRDRIIRVVPVVLEPDPVVLGGVHAGVETLVDVIERAQDLCGPMRAT